MGETPSFNQDEVLNNIMDQSSFEHNFSLANSLDQFFGTNLRSSLMDKYAQQSNSTKMKISLENLTKTAFANKSWNSLFNQSLQNAMKEAMEQNKKFEGFKSLSHQLQQLANSSPNMHSSQKISQKIPEIVKKTLESSENPYELKTPLL